MNNASSCEIPTRADFKIENSSKWWVIFHQLMHLFFELGQNANCVVIHRFINKTDECAKTFVAHVCKNVSNLIE